MAHHSSTEKSIRKTASRTAANRSRSTRIKTYIKKVIVATEKSATSTPNKEKASKALIAAQSELMRGVTKGLIKKNTASRKISRLAKRIKALVLSDKL